MEREQAKDFDQRLLDLYDDFAHGRVSRREFVRRAAVFAVGGMTAEALLERLGPNYALAQQVTPDDARIQAEYITFDSPKGAARSRDSSPGRRPRTRSSRPCSSSTRIAG